MVVIIRQVGTININKGKAMANGLYNISDTNNDKLSLWFDEEMKDELMSLTDEEFTKEANTIFNDLI